MFSVKRELRNHKYFWVIRSNSKIVSSTRYNPSITKDFVVAKVNSNDLSFNDEIYKKRIGFNKQSIETFDTRSKAHIDPLNGSNFQITTKIGKDIIVVRSRRFSTRSELSHARAEAQNDFFDIVTAKQMGDMYKGKDDPKFQRMKSRIKNQYNSKKRSRLEGIVSYHDV